MVSAPPACTVGHMCRDCKHGDGIGHNVTVVIPQRLLFGFYHARLLTGWKLVSFFKKKLRVVVC